MEHINLFLVFAEGVLSLFSPCILPVLPIYLSILSSSSVDNLKSGKVKFISSSLFKNTILFVFGISTTFFILGSSVSALNYFIKADKNIIALIGGIVIVFMGIFYMGLIKIPFLQREKKIHVDIKEMKPVTAYILGFAFSFAWTPCVGPMLSSVLIMASTSGKVVTGNILILVYTLGFILPFVIIAVFYDKLFKLMDKLKHHMQIIQKIGGALLIASGLVIIISNVNIEVNLKNKTTQQPVKKEQSTKAEDSKNKSQNTSKVKAPDFTLIDQYGKTHKLSDYKGKVVFLNFWATWCPPCRGELPNIEDIYKEYGKDNNNVIILGITAPNLGREGSKQDIINFMNKNSYTFLVMFDSNGDVMNEYSIEAFPTTFIIDKEGNVKEYVPGAMEKSTMETLINGAK